MWRTWKRRYPGRRQDKSRGHHKNMVVMVLMRMAMVLPIHTTIEDAIFSAANYLSKSGAADGDLEKAIFNYNHSEKYVQDVLYFYQ